MRCSRVTISGCRTVGPETVATALGGSRRAETAPDSSNRLASLSLGLSEPSAHRPATGDALDVLSAHMKGSTEYVDWMEANHRKTPIPKVQIFRIAIAERAERNGHGAPPEI